jgi:hypothetical protein
VDELERFRCILHDGHTRAFQEIFFLEGVGRCTASCYLLMVVRNWRASFCCSATGYLARNFVKDMINLDRLSRSRIVI